MSSFVKVDLALEEVTRLQVEGPSEEDVATVLELEQRTYENGQQVFSWIYFSLCQFYHVHYSSLHSKRIVLLFPKLRVCLLPSGKWILVGSTLASLSITGLHWRSEGILSGRILL